MKGSTATSGRARACLKATSSAAALLIAGWAAPGLAQTQADPQAATSAPNGQDSSTVNATTAPSGDQGVVNPAAGSDASGGDVVVTGVRASLSSAQGIKRNADQIVDSIVAEDIGKLPDRNVAEALQRITGIQIQRSFG